jgi:hypothetical protein
MATAARRLMPAQFAGVGEAGAGTDLFPWDPAVRENLDAPLTACTQLTVQRWAALCGESDGVSPDPSTALYGGWC